MLRSDRTDIRSTPSRLSELTGRVVEALYGPAAGDSVLPRYPTIRHGYDWDAVEAEVARLEAELATRQAEIGRLRSALPSRTDIASEIERLGEETSAILITAHVAATETADHAQSAAQRSVAEASSYVAALRAEADGERAAVQSELTVLRRERTRLIDQAQTIARQLSELAAGA